MEPKLITFRKFDDIALAYTLVELLKEHNIPYLLEEVPTTFDLGFRTIDPALKENLLKIRSSDFDRVNQLLKEQAAIEINNVEADYYLFGFSDDELIEVLSKADEWGAFDILLAEKILTDRGKNFSNETIITLNKQRLEELRKPEISQILWVMIGYICAIGGGILGIFIGWHLFSQKKTLPNGEKVFEYNEDDRKHGKRIFYISVTVFALLFIAKMVGIFLGLPFLSFPDLFWTRSY